ncbi:MAG: hypothetical protein ACOCV2_03425 [Persicimonas sp.]
MLIGFNNDVEYRGKTFHIQTEDHGEGDPRIETQLFHSGAILDTVITSYEEVLEEHDGEEAEERIRAQMKASHRSLYKKLLGGEYDEMAGLDPVEDSGEVEAPDPDEFQPSQERVPAAAAKVEEKAEEEGEDAILEFQKKKAKDHVSLDKLKDQLSDIDEEGEVEGDEEDDVAPTEVLDTGKSDLDFSSVTDSEPAADPSPRAARIPDWRETGESAWQGCMPPDDSLSLTDLVEEFLAQ